MNYNDYEWILDRSRRRVREVSLDKKRFLFDSIDWRDRLICVLGARGTGKTTLLLQHIKTDFSENPDAALYASLDNLWFKTHALEDLAETHYKNGGSHLFLDEIHYLKDWQLILKNMYDDFPGLHIVYSGSSLLKIDTESGDLSRRQIIYHLPGLSFREYLDFENVLQTEAVSLQHLLENHLTLANAFAEKTKVLHFFNQYLAKGYYPFYKEVYAGYELRMQQMINQILESDYPSTESISYATVQKIKKMLYILAQSCPQTPNMQELYRELETDRNQGLRMLYILEKADLLSLLSSKDISLTNMARPDKVYCDNTNIMFSLTENINTGTKRETFFLNQLRAAGYAVRYPRQGDFLVNDKYLFEVGGRRKSFDQIKDIADSYLAIDDVEVGRGNKIPLWLFGFLY